MTLDELRAEASRLGYKLTRIPGQLSERERARLRKVSAGLAGNPSGRAATPEAEAERRRRIARTLTGTHQTAEHRARRAEAMKASWARRRAANR